MSCLLGLPGRNSPDFTCTGQKWQRLCGDKVLPRFCFCPSQAAEYRFFQGVEPKGCGNRGKTPAVLYSKTEIYWSDHIVNPWRPCEVPHFDFPHFSRKVYNKQCLFFLLTRPESSSKFYWSDQFNNIPPPSTRERKGALARFGQKEEKQ